MVSGNLRVRDVCNNLDYDSPAKNYCKKLKQIHGKRDFFNFSL